MKRYNFIKSLVIQLFVYKDYLEQLLTYTLSTSIRRKLSNIKVLNTEDSIDFIVKNKCSISRYGDGEFSIAWQYLTGETILNDSYFQKYDAALGKRLAEILKQTNFNNNVHAVAISYSYYHGVRGLVFDARRYLMYFINKYHDLLLTSVNPQRLYLNSELTRFYITRKDKNRSKTIIKKLSKIWSGRCVCFIEGEKSRLGVGNDLFDNAASITRILCPAEDAWGRYEEILDSAKKQPKDTLFLIALGMTATVLAYDLSKLGFQSIDIGHIDIEYEWMKMGVKEKTPIPNKYTNEAEGGKTPLSVSDGKYKKQIIDRIGC